MSEYSMKMQEVFSIAQYQAARFESPYLESWHVLLAMVAVHDSVAGLTFAEYQNKIAYEEYEDVYKRQRLVKILDKMITFSQS